MKKQAILFILSIAIIRSNLNADILAELAKRNEKNPIPLSDNSACVFYTKDGYLHTEYRSDGFGVPSIVAYKIQEDAVTLIVRFKTWDFAFRFFDPYYSGRFGTDQFTVVVHDYYLVELVYVNDKLETYCNRVSEINANGFIYNEAQISGNIKKVSDYYKTYPHLGKNLTEGMKVKIAALTNERTTNDIAENHYTYDYNYQILADGEQANINGYLLDFSNKIDYRAPLLILKSGNTSQPTPPEEAKDYFGTWRYSGTGGLGYEERRRTITITISADKFHYHYNGHTRYNNEWQPMEYEYTLVNPTWTKIIRPDEDFQGWVEMPDDHFKGASGYLITGTIADKTGDYPDTDTISEYIYLNPDDKNIMYWYNFSVSNYFLFRQK